MDTLSDEFYVPVFQEKRLGASGSAAGVQFKI